MNSEVQRIFRNIINDIAVEMKEEFDLNFEREAFFSEKWQRRKSPIRNKDRAILTDSGRLRSSISSRTTDHSITFYTTLPYAEIHNDGGEIVVTKRMKMFFRYKFYQANKMTRKSARKRRGSLSDGGFYAWTADMNMSPDAEFWRLMSLKKVGSTIVIPRRRFLGTSPEVEKKVREIIEDNITEYFNVEFEINRK